MKSIVEYADYKTFLLDWINEQPRSGRGLRSKLATSLRCRPAYLSRVFNGDVDLSPEQAFRAARFLGLSTFDSKYFRRLNDIARAATFDLKETLVSELKELKNQSLSLKQRMGLKQVLEAGAEEEYYSSWQLAVAHLALTLPTIDSREKLSKSLRLPLERVSEIVSILVRCGLVAEKAGRLRVEKHLMHGDPRSPRARRHLTNLHLKAIDVLQLFDPENFHYSAVVSVSRDDFTKIREIFAAAMAQSAELIKLSAEEQVAIVNLDWFVVS